MILFLRHFKPKDSSQGDDFFRELADNQEIDCIKEKIGEVDFAIVSPATRARQTFELLNLNCPCQLDLLLYDLEFKNDLSFSLIHQKTSIEAFNELIQTIQTLNTKYSRLLVLGHDGLLQKLAFTLSQNPKALCRLGFGELIILDDLKNLKVFSRLDELF